MMFLLPNKWKKELEESHMANAELELGWAWTSQNLNCPLYIMVPYTYHRGSDVQLLPGWILENNPSAPGFHPDCPPIANLSKDFLQPV